MLFIQRGSSGKVPGQVGQGNFHTSKTEVGQDQEQEEQRQKDQDQDTPGMIFHTLFF